MATVYHETYTKPLPQGAELFTRDGQRFARWTDRRGRKRAARVTTPAKGKHAGQDRIILECSTHVAKYRDGSGLVRKVGTGCKTKDGATSVLKGLTDRAELVKAKVMTPGQDAAATNATSAIGEHIDLYLSALGRIASPAHVANVRRALHRLRVECRYGRLADLRGDALETWLAARQAEGMSARTANTYLSAASALAAWCCQNNRLVGNPFAAITPADEKADRRRTRRALTEDELRRLLIVARLRPLADFGRATVKTEADLNKPKRAHWTRATLTFDEIADAAERGRVALAKRPDFIAELEHRGRERAMIYKALVLTGLRKGELASLTGGATGPRRRASLRGLGGR